MKKFFSKFSKLLLAIVLSLSMVSSSLVSASSNVSPMVNETLSPGESFTVTKEVVTSAIPAKLDFLLLIDLSGSYSDDLVNIKSLDDGLFDSIRAEVPDSRFALASFVDYPTYPWGDASYGDYAYKLDKDFTTDKAVWTGAIGTLSVKYGGDSPESQYAGLKGSADNATWRSDATKVIAITTDASFHVPTDTSGTYPGPSRNDTVASLNALGIKVIAIKAPGSGAQMNDIATATGGSVVTTTSTSSDIAVAILAGLGNLPVTVTANVTECDPLDVVLTPASQTVVSGNTATFTETITVPNDSSLEGTSVSCTVVFTDGNGNVIGDQSIVINIPDDTPPVITLNGVTPNIEVGSPYTELGATALDNVDGSFPATPSGSVNTATVGSYVISYNATDSSGNVAIEVTRTVNVVDTTPPVVQCVPSVNPSGKNIPKASSQNEDGFYKVSAVDKYDGVLGLFINTFGPFASGDTVKITEAPGAVPEMKKIGSEKANNVVMHLILNSDAVVTATDSSGNASSVTCYVPPMPK